MRRSELYRTTGGRNYTFPAFPGQGWVGATVGGLVHGSTVLICGGTADRGSSDCYSVELSRSTPPKWGSFPSLNAARQWADQVVLPNRSLWVTGGSPSHYHDKSLASTETYRSALNKWVIGPSLPRGLGGHCSTLVNSTHVLFTGGVGDGNYYDECYWFDIEHSTFTSAGQLRGGPRAYHGCTTLPDGRIIVAGGNVMKSPPFGSASSSVVILDPSSMTWVDGPSLPQALQALALLTVDGEVLSFGGGSLRGSPAEMTYANAVYVLGPHGWNATTPMRDQRGYFTAFVIPDFKQA